MKRGKDKIDKNFKSNERIQSYQIKQIKVKQTKILKAMRATQKQ